MKILKQILSSFIVILIIFSLFSNTYAAENKTETVHLVALDETTTDAVILYKKCKTFKDIN